MEYAMQKRDKSVIKNVNIETPNVQVIEYEIEGKAEHLPKKPQKNYDFVSSIYMEIERLQKPENAPNGMDLLIKQMINTELVSGEKIKSAAIALVALSDELEKNNSDKELKQAIDNHRFVREYRERQALRDFKAKVKEKVTPEMQKQIDSLLEPFERMRNEQEEILIQHNIYVREDIRGKLNAFQVYLENFLLISISKDPDIVDDKKAFTIDTLMSKKKKLDKEMIACTSSEITADFAKYMLVMNDLDKKKFTPEAVQPYIEHYNTSSELLGPLEKMKYVVQTEYANNPKKKVEAMQVIDELKTSLEKAVATGALEDPQVNFDNYFDNCKKKLSSFRGLFDKLVALFDVFRKTAYETKMEKQVNDTTTPFKARLKAMKQGAKALQLEKEREQNKSILPISPGNEL